MPAPERPDLYVVARLLDRLWRANGPMRKTHLQLAANVNYDILTRYLAWLRERGLVAVYNDEDGHDAIVLTQRGHQACGTLVRWIDEVVRGG
jgi:predicted transcriptional regulator